ncbi:hypothetical protein [Delftia sp. HK171]|uniref:hypothetical protein n=1 Tax=Delftia sp. HK171 TaxID=1920191 RepID=UPI00114DD420|nr:hypothetical protein [Delftia sp. HK171]
MALLNSTELQALQPWASVIAASIAAVVAIIFGLMQVAIAWRQAKTAADKLRLDLFDRRLEIYKAVKAAIGDAVHTGDVTQAEENEFRIATNATRWVFDNRVHTYVSSTLPLIFGELHRTYAEIQEIRHQHHPDHIQKAREHVYAAIRREWTNVDEVFAPYLQLQT